MRTEGDTRENEQYPQKLHQRKGKHCNNTKRGKSPRHHTDDPPDNSRRKHPRSDDDSAEDPAINTIVIPLNYQAQKIAGASPLIRLVEPYPYTFETHAKGRWLGRTILDVYSTEFGSYPDSYYSAAIEQGRILVSNRIVDTSYRIQNNDLLAHTVHRHEPAVAVSMADPPHVKLVAETDTLLAVDKPSTLPIHPCGGYHENSLMNILAKAGHVSLHTIHRLDRLTSGLVVLAKSKAVASQWGKAIQERDSCQKIYLARVKGKFPLNCPAAIPRLDDNGMSEKPVFGEWQLKREAILQANLPRSHEDEVAISRRRNAAVCWFTTISGQPVANMTFDCFADQTNSCDVWINACEKDRNPIASSDNNHLVWFHLALPVRIAREKNGVCHFGTFDDLDPDLYRKTVKSAETSFAIMHYDAETDSTVLICRPRTGRTHQIRLHLQALGHPIANDPNYGGDLWYGNPAGEQIFRKAEQKLREIDAKNDNESIEHEDATESRADENVTIGLLEGHCLPRNDLVGAVDTANNEKSLVCSDVPVTNREMKSIKGLIRDSNEPMFDFIRRTCVWCKRSRGMPQHERSQLEFLVRSQGIWLHALQYSVALHENDCISFRADLPDWSKPRISISERR